MFLKFSSPSWVKVGAPLEEPLNYAAVVERLIEWLIIEFRTVGGGGFYILRTGSAFWEDEEEEEEDWALSETAEAEEELQRRSWGEMVSNEEGNVQGKNVLDGEAELKDLHYNKNAPDID